jgi:glycosyltransferase involved in cell wall biosynthesis
MKIAIFNTTTLAKHGGVETFCLQIAEHLSKKGVLVDIYSGRRAFEPKLPKEIKIFEFDFTHRDKIINIGSRFKKLMERISFAKNAWKTLINNRYDYIYIHKPYDFLPAYLYKLKTGAKIIYSSHGTEFYPGYKTFIKKMDILFACSEFNAKELLDYSGVKPYVLYNGVNTDIFKKLERDEQLADTLHARGKKVFFTACRLVGWKGVQIAIAALSKIKEQNFVYFIAGEGDYKPKLEALVGKLGLQEKVKFLGRVENGLLPKYYSISDFALYPSVANETFGISVAEAALCGVCVISTKIGGIPEVINTTENLAEGGSEESLRAAIENLMQNETLKNSVTASNEAFIRANYSWDVITKRFLERISQ